MLKKLKDYIKRHKEKKQSEVIASKLKWLAENQKPQDPRIGEIINRRFWDLFD